MRISRSFFLVPVFLVCLPLSSWAQTTCSSSVSDTDGDGWGWENNQTCRVVAASSSATGFPVCSSSQSDTNGDGFGWENNATCQVSSNSGSSAAPSVAAALAAFPVCSSSQADPNGDGWGFENGRSCRVQAGQAATESADSFGNFATCSAGIADPDGDGWAFENGSSCRVQTGQAAIAGADPFASFATCSAGIADPDGDGWAFENGSSCRVQAGQAAAVSTDPFGSFATCSAGIADPDGDGWAFENGSSCRISGTSQTSPAASNGSSPSGVRFRNETLRRLGSKGDNFDQTWAADDSVITALDDGDWFNERFTYHSQLYRLRGQANGFSVSEVQNYPEFHVRGDGWFAYGVLSVDGVLYSLVSKTQTAAWSHGPFRGMKMLRSYDGGNTWNRVDKNNNDRFLSRSDSSRELLNDNEMFFFEEFGRFGKGRTAYPFSYATFVQNGRDHQASKDGYVYIYAPEGANSHQLLLARVRPNQLGQRSAWQYFSGWNGNTPRWTSNIEQRQPNLVYPERASNGEYFGWYSWLPSVVWNEGLGVYIMASGGTYAGGGGTNSANDYYHQFMHNRSGTLGFWYSENPYGPWKRFYYNENWTVDDSANLTYQPKLSPKWISSDGRRMTLIWSDAMRDANGHSHSVNYQWNQMEIDITTR